jgi:hypothetical protein
MARIEGTQNIPSELKYFYDGTLTPLMPNAAIRSRYPWHVTQVQEGGPKESEGHKKQRARWKAIRDKFKTLTKAERQRWYAAAPPWGSLLFYYNYFMMSGLVGNAVVGDKGGGVIKDIHHYTFTLPAGTPQDVTIAIDECDPTKAVPFFFGAGWFDVVTGAVALVYPYLASLSSTQMIVRASLMNGEAVGCSVSLIEYI